MTFKIVLNNIIQRTPDVKSFRFSRPSSFAYKAGQYLIIILPDNNGSVQKKPLTISSSPTEDFIEVTKKLTSGHSFSDSMSSISIGDELQIDAPFGQFVLDEPQKKIAMFSGGIGITPFRSMCKYAIDSGLETDIVLLYGNKTSEDIVFKDEFDLMQETNNHFKIVHTLSREDSNWNGHIGHIDGNMVKIELPDYSQRLFYLCGPPGMVKAMEDLLEGLEVSKKQIIKEKFTPY